MVVNKVLELAATGDEIAKVGFEDKASSQLEIFDIGAIVLDILIGCLAPAAKHHEFQLAK